MMARICLAPPPQERREPCPGTKMVVEGPPCSARSALSCCLRPLGASFSPSVTVSDLCCWLFCLLPCRRRGLGCVMAACRLRWQHRAPWSFLFLFVVVVVVVVLPLLIPMTQGGHHEPAHVGREEDRHSQSQSPPPPPPPVDGGGEHAEAEEGEEQQLSRLGSRPPCCDHRCGACAPCKAVQVRAGAAAERRLIRPRCANYEPVGWKCSCGDAVFDP